MTRRKSKKVEEEEKAPRPEESGSDLSSSDSESDYIEDDEGALVTPQIDAQILKTLAEIRSRSGKIYDPETRFFDEKDLERAEEDWVQRAGKEGEKVTLTDYQRERLLKGELHSEESNGEEADFDRPMTHYEEQEQLKREFKLALDGGEDESDEAEEIFRKRPKTAEQQAKEEEDYRAFLLENLSKSENARESMGDWLSYKADQKGTKTSVDPEEQFLIDYVLNRGWVDQEKKVTPDYERIIQADEEDLEAVEKAEEFETALNFRFEQPGAAQVITYARNIEGSMRREESKRKEQRAAKKARKEAEVVQHQEEVKRRKNELKAELQEKLRKIQEVAAIKGKPLEDLDAALDLEDSEDFDLEEHDRKMGTLFDQEFYGEDDDEKPVFTSDEEYQAYIDDGIEPDVIDDDEEGENPAEESDDEFAPKIIERPTAATRMTKIKEELYKLDYEDVIGKPGDSDAVKCKFRYTSVLPTSFGLETKEILAADETLLNKHVSLKKLAPYRPVDKQKHDIQKLSDKRKVYMFRKELWDSQKAAKEARHSKKTAGRSK